MVILLHPFTGEVNEGKRLQEFPVSLLSTIGCPAICVVDTAAMYCPVFELSTNMSPPDICKLVDQTYLIGTEGEEVTTADGETVVVGLPVVDGLNEGFEGATEVGLSVDG